MKTTIDLPDELAAQAKRAAATYGITMRSLIEDALRRELERRQIEQEWSPRVDLTFGDGGLIAEVRGASWAELRGIAMSR